MGTKQQAHLECLLFPVHLHREASNGNPRAAARDAEKNPQAAALDSFSQWKRGRSMIHGRPDITSRPQT
jgi:hypothetical protein